MPIILIFFILFIIWVNVKTKRGATDNSKWDTSYWEKEREANFVRKKDISNLDYITISEDELPFSDTARGEEKYRQDEVRRTLSCKILNLSGIEIVIKTLSAVCALYFHRFLLSICKYNYILSFYSSFVKYLLTKPKWNSILDRQCEFATTIQGCSSSVE